MYSNPKILAHFWQLYMYVWNSFDIQSPLGWVEIIGTEEKKRIWLRKSLSFECDVKHNKRKKEGGGGVVSPKVVWSDYLTNANSTWAELTVLHSVPLFCWPIKGLLYMHDTCTHFWLNISMVQVHVWFK